MLNPKHTTTVPVTDNPGTQTARPKGAKAELLKVREKIIRAEIKKRYTSLEAFCADINCKEVTLRKFFKNGAQFTTYNFVIRLCDALNLDPYTFYPLDKTTQGLYRMNKVLDKFTQLNFYGQRKILEQLDDYLKLPKYTETGIPEEYKIDHLSYFHSPVVPQFELQEGQTLHGDTALIREASKELITQEFSESYTQKLIEEGKRIEAELKDEINLEELNAKAKNLEERRRQDSVTNLRRLLQNETTPPAKRERILQLLEFYRQKETRFSFKKELATDPEEDLNATLIDMDEYLEDNLDFDAIETTEPWDSLEAFDPKTMFDTLHIDYVPEEDPTPHDFTTDEDDTYDNEP